MLSRTVNSATSSFPRLPSRPANVLIGCAPCQGFSSHRNDEGERRSAQLQERERLLPVSRRRFSRMRSLSKTFRKSSRNGIGRLSSAPARLENAGYYVHRERAQHGRVRRAARAIQSPDAGHETPLLAPPEGFLTRDDFPTVRDAISGLPPIEPGRRHPLDPMHFSAGHKQSTIETIRAVPKDGGSRPDHVGPACLRRAKQRTGKAIYEDVHGRLYWDKPAITITAYARNPASGRFVHPEQDRGLTVREAALLQGFPRITKYRAALMSDSARSAMPYLRPFLRTAMHVVGEMLATPLQAKTFDKGIIAPVGHSFSRMIPSSRPSGNGSRPPMLTEAAVATQHDYSEFGAPNRMKRVLACSPFHRGSRR